MGRRAVKSVKIEQSEFPSPLIPIVCGEIEASGGAISFRRFMDLSLYHPTYGYYSSGRARIGKAGDFFTSVSVGKIYGRLLASICREVWEQLGSPSEFLIVEQGADDGTLAKDILETASGKSDAFAAAIRYLIVEPFPANQKRQHTRLTTFANISWIDSLADLPDFIGIHLSNELLDAFPVHSLRWDGADWLEEFVCGNESQLGWTTRPITDPQLKKAAAHLPVNLPAGFRTEWNPELRPWLRQLHERMERGISLTVDYGQAGEDRYAPHRADGTLLAYRAHERFHDPLPEPGQRDITAQVDFTTLAAEAGNIGFEILGYSDQHHFLMGTAESWLRSLGDSTTGGHSDLRSLQTLLHPSLMGMQFKAIALGKDFAPEPTLSCFKFQRPGIGAL